MRRDFLVEGDPAAGKCPEGVRGGGGGCVEGARSETGAAREESVGGEALERFSQSGRRGHDDLKVIIAAGRACTAVSRATLSWRMISTAPSAVLGMAVD